MNWDKIFEKIEFDVKVDNLEDVFQRFQKYIHEDDNEYTLDGYTLQTYMMSEKVNETDAEVPATRGTRRPATRAERRKDTAHAKNRRKSMATYADDEIRMNSGKVINTGWRSYEKGAKIYTRKGRVTREKFTEEPFNPWYDPDYLEDVDYETGLHLPVGTGYWSDETLSEAINNHNNPYYDYDWEEILEDDEEELEELDEILDEDDDEVILVDAEEGDDELVDGLRQLNHQLELEVRKLYDFINEYNLNKLFSQWGKSH